ncbi:CsbD family protein [Couchioplanes azureus]|uniref:hypothetical protein n=1 Tax=Couchioplanes caeruleus TaxID=56438 RepID=UPI0016711396|nr:hypothetical protein [Couchioplanes caeruleus]GGQ68388.1 hypothetical protein GCM10010166_43040 [Couchioplanes caeruleus subsp. azureus]
MPGIGGCATAGLLKGRDAIGDATGNERLITEGRAQAQRLRTELVEVDLLRAWAELVEVDPLWVCAELVEVDLLWV